MNISQIDNSSNIYTNSFDLITKYCRRITKLIVPTYPNRDQMIELVTKHGQWLQEFTMIPNQSCLLPDYLKILMQMCPNIKKIDFGDRFKDVIHELESLKKLRVIEGVLCIRNIGSKVWHKS